LVDGSAQLVVEHWGSGSEQKQEGAGAEAGQREAVYLSLANAAKAVGVVLPVVPGAQKDKPTALLPMQVAEIRWVKTVASLSCVGVFGNSIIA
jgi:hypothetical protein